MKTENDERLPDSASRAFENYPHIAASPDFNRRVLDKVLAARAPSQLELLCDRMDEIFARPILKLLGAAFLGGILAFVGSSILVGWSSPTGQPQNAPLVARVDEDSSLDSHNRIAMMRELEIPYALQHEYSKRGWGEFDLPAKREKSVEETDSKQRSSECPAAFHSLA